MSKKYTQFFATIGNWPTIDKKYGKSLAISNIMLFTRLCARVSLCIKLPPKKSTFSQKKLFFCLRV